MWRWSSLPSCGKCLRLWLQPGPRDSNCFSAVLGWMEHIMWHFLPPRQASAAWLSPSPLPRGSHSYDPAYAGGPRTAICTRLQQTFSACRWFSAAWDYLTCLTLTFSQVTPQSLGWTEVMNEWSSLEPGTELKEGFYSGKTIPLSLAMTNNPVTLCWKWILKCCSRVNRSGFSF